MDKTAKDVQKTDASPALRHHGHRKRTKEEFRAAGLRGFNEYRTLEFLLYYAVPQKDTNELAHALIERFGSFGGVFRAKIPELMAVEGVGENVATYLRLIAESAAYLLSSDSRRAKFHSMEEIGTYLTHLYVSEPNEVVMLILLGNDGEWIDTVRLHEGSINSVALSPRVVVETALLRRAAAIVLAHNHPGGLAVPSGDDLHTTEQLVQATSLVGIQFIEHFVVAGRTVTPILNHRDAHSFFRREN